jgi:hypothetical protein
MGNTTKQKHSNHKRKRVLLATKKVWAYICLIALILLFQKGFGQLLDTEVTLKASNKPLSQVLFQLSEQAHFDFSYDTRIISPYQTVTVNANHQPLKKVLGSVCSQSNIQYKLIGTQIIFFSAKKEEVRRVEHLIKGKVTDYRTGKLLQGVTITEKYFQINTNTDDEGGYQISVPNPNYTVQLTYSLEGYQRKSYLVKVSDNKTFNVSLKSENDTKNTIAAADSTPPIPSISFTSAIAQKILEVKHDSIKIKKQAQPLIQKKSLRLFVPQKTIDSLKKDSTLNVVPYQFSVIPGIGYNAQYGGKNIVEGISFNLFGGLNAGIDGIEVGTIVNLTRFNVNGVQVSGIANLVGGQTSGIQTAGIVNISKLKTHGVQAAGISNLSGQEMEGVQAAGINNVVRGNMRGVQAAGIHNLVTGYLEGVQAGGFANTAWGNVDGGQVAGFLNIAKGKVYGPQIAGFLNLAKEVKGIQVAGFLNYAHKMKGVQIGVFNFIDSLEGGLPIGFFNYVGNGYRRFEIQGNETGIINLKFKSGTHKLYTYIGFGVKDNGAPNNWLWDVNYGIGTIFRHQKPVFFGLELSSHWLHQETWSNEINMLSRLDANVGIRLYKSLAITVGPSINFYVVHQSLEQGTTINKSPLLLDEAVQQTQLQGWAGFNASIQF